MDNGSETETERNSIPKRRRKWKKYINKKWKYHHETGIEICIYIYILYVYIEGAHGPIYYMCVDRILYLFVGRLRESETNLYHTRYSSLKPARNANRKLRWREFFWTCFFVCVCVWCVSAVSVCGVSVCVCVPRCSMSHVAANVVRNVKARVQVRKTI